MTLRLTMLLAILAFLSSCKKKADSNLFDEQCVTEKLKEINIIADIEMLDNSSPIKLVLKKPYKTVDESQQKLLLDFLVPCFDVKKTKDNIEFIVTLDKELGQYENNFHYTSYDVLNVLQKDATLKEIHQYILKEFDKKDMIVLNNFIAGFYNNYPYKEDIYNVEFIELLKRLKNEKNDSDKAKLTFLLIYGTSKESKSKDLKDIPKHLKTIWDMLIKSDINKVLSETFS